MAVFEEITYGVQCDICGKVYMNEYSRETLFVNAKLAKEEAQEDQWLIEDGKCYCPDCFEIDEDDNVIIKEKNQHKTNRI